MKLTSFLTENRSAYGIVTDSGVIDLSRLSQTPDNLCSALTDPGAEQLAVLGAELAPDFALDEISYAPPITEEYDDTTLPPYPSVFMRTPGSLVGHLQSIVRPPESEQFDYEGEIAIVIGKPGRRITQDNAEAHIAGLTILQEGSVRDWMRHGKFNVTQGKNFDRSGAVGPWLVTADEFDSYDDLPVTTRVNGEQRQHDTTANLLFSFSYLISYLSTFTGLQTGDIISTGTPTGAGARFDPPRFLVPGDEVTVEVPGIGLLRNTVVDE